MQEQEENLNFNSLNSTLRIAKVADVMSSPEIVIVRPAVDDVFPHRTLHQELAQRLLTACKNGAQQRAEIRTSRELCELAVEELRDAILLVVGPLECMGTSGDSSTFVSAFASAGRRILASAVPVGSPWYEKQFIFPLKFDAVFDVGFVSQEHKHSRPDVAYHFVFNGSTRDEERTICELTPPRERSILWALVGYPTARRLELATRLTEDLDPGGFVFMPGEPSRLKPDGFPWWPQPLARHEKLSPSSLATVLSKSSYYVWSSAHDLAYYESFRFIVAMKSGAVPCKIVHDGTSQGLSDIPGVFPSVAALCFAVQEEGAQSLYRLARDFYLSKGSLDTHLEEALKRV